jgi:hypothetical protein
MEIDDEAGVESRLSGLGREPNSGLIVLLDAFTYVHHDFIIIGQVARHQIPAIYTVRAFAESGGLVESRRSVQAGGDLRGSHSQGE